MTNTNRTRLYKRIAKKWEAHAKAGGRIYDYDVTDMCLMNLPEDFEKLSRSDRAVFMGTSWACSIEGMEPKALHMEHEYCVIECISPTEGDRRTVMTLPDGRQFYFWGRIKSLTTNQT